jgi:hypothetical protein
MWETLVGWALAMATLAVNAGINRWNAATAFHNEKTKAEYEFTTAKLEELHVVLSEFTAAYSGNCRAWASYFIQREHNTPNPVLPGLPDGPDPRIIMLINLYISELKPLLLPVLESRQEYLKALDPVFDGVGDAGPIKAAWRSLHQAVLELQGGIEKLRESKYNEYFTRPPGLKDLNANLHQFRKWLPSRNR